MPITSDTAEAEVRRVDTQLKATDAEAPARLDIGSGVPDEYRPRRVDVGECAHGAEEHADARLAAITFADIMWAVHERIDASPGRCVEQVGEPRMDRREVALGHAAEGDSALVGHDHHQRACVVEAADRVRRTGQEPQLVGGRHVLPFGSLDVDGPVAIEERGSAAVTPDTAPARRARR